MGLGNLLILTSPPATGKTFLIQSLIDELEGSSILVLSPLRALADECKSKWAGNVVVMTPEEWIAKKIVRKIVIFDEFHLLYYWGDSFRPLMWEVFYELSISAQLVLGLTATLSNSMKLDLELFSPQFDQINWINYGNQQLKYLPILYLKAPSKNWIIKQIENSRRGEVQLIFCQYREEVFGIQKRLSSLGYDCLSCVGGEAGEMESKLLNKPRPDFIICTTVLSHGVNLPSISKIYFLYQVKNLDFWIQMVARGGRKGESFQVFSLEKPHQIRWSSWKNLLLVIHLSIKEYFSIRSLLRDLFISK